MSAEGARIPLESESLRQKDRGATPKRRTCSPGFSTSKGRGERGRVSSGHCYHHQQLSFKLRADHPAFGHGHLVQRAHEVHPVPLLRRRLAPHVRQFLVPRRQPGGRHDLLPGAGHCGGGAGGHRQHRGCVWCHYCGRPRCHFLDVDHRASGHGHQLRRGR